MDRFQNSDIWRFYGALLRPSARRIALTALALALLSLLYLPIVAIARWVVDGAGAEAGAWTLAGTAALIAILLSAHFVASIAVKRAILEVCQSVGATLRTRLFDRLLALSRASYTHQDLQSLRHVFVTETERLDAFSYLLLVQVAPAILGSLVLLAVLIVLSPSLLLVLVVVTIGFGFATQILRHGLSVETHRYRNAFERYVKESVQIPEMLDLIHLQSMEKGEKQRLAAVTDETAQASKRVWFRRAIHADSLNFIMITSVLIVFLAGILVSGGAGLSKGDLAAFVIVMGLMFGILRPVWQGYGQIALGLEALRDMRAFLEPTEQDLPLGGTRTLPDFSGHVALQDVSFDYGGSPVLERFSLEIRPGERVILVGPSGVGKTTLLSLLLGLYRHKAGTITADGISYEELDLIDLRRRIGVVPQGDLLWPGTIRENIVYGNGDVAEDRFEAACRMAAVAAFVADLPDGYDTRIGEHGTLLSGGQIQRIAIARALLRAPALLILDEPTSHLDDVNADAVLDALFSLPHKPAILFITHDPRIVERADRVVRLERDMP